MHSAEIDLDAIHYGRFPAEHEVLSFSPQLNELAIDYNYSAETRTTNMAGELCPDGPARMR